MWKVSAHSRSALSKFISNICCYAVRNAHWFCLNFSISFIHAYARTENIMPFPAVKQDCNHSSVFSHEKEWKKVYRLLFLTLFSISEILLQLLPLIRLNRKIKTGGIFILSSWFIEHIFYGIWSPTWIRLKLGVWVWEAQQQAAKKFC